MSTQNYFAELQPEHGFGFESYTNKNASGNFIYVNNFL